MHTRTGIHACAGILVDLLMDLGELLSMQTIKSVNDLFEVPHHPSQDVVLKTGADGFDLG